MRRRLLLLVPALLGAVLVSRCDLFFVPPEDFESDSTIGTLRVTVPWVAPWVTAALDGTRAYLRISTIALELQDSEGAAVTSTVLDGRADKIEESPTITLNWTVPIGDSYRLKADITNASSTPALVLSGLSDTFSVPSGVIVPVTVTCLPVSPTVLTEDTPSVNSLLATGEQWFTATAAGTDTRFYCDTTSGGTADIWVFDEDGIFQDYAAGSANDVLHLDTVDGEICYVGIYASTAATASVMFASTTMDLTVAVGSVTYSAGKVTVRYTVTNTGIDTAGAFQVDFSDGGSGSASKKYNSLAPGTVSGSVKFSTGLTGGVISAVVDPLEQVDESDEDNNTDSLSWTAGTGSTGISVQ